MTTHAPVPAFRRVWFSRVVGLAVASFLALAVISSPAPAAPKSVGKATWLQGYVDRTSGQAIQLRGRWYELAGAAIVDAHRQSLSSAQIKKGAYIYMRVENGKVAYLRVFQDLGR